MIIVKLQGGLGNQMFQYAVARSLSGTKEVRLDHYFLNLHNTSHEHFTARPYELGIFKHLKSKKANRYIHQLLFSRKLMVRIARRLFPKIIQVVRQQENEWVNFSTIDLSKPIYLDGYFQSEKYFKSIRNALLEEFKFPMLDEPNNQIADRISTTANSVSLHVRRGDYLKSSKIGATHGIIPLSYYQKAIGDLKSKYNNITLFIFSDDPEWVKENLDRQGLDFFIVTGNLGENSWKDMNLMSLCTHHIIANSSFSWWGAWLAQKNGEKFAPAQWFNPKQVKFNIHDFVPEKWQIVHYD